MEILKNLIRQKHLWVLFAFWVVTRIATSLYYIADPDSLRFALAALDFDPMNAQPHFPLYPVFVFISQVSSFMMGSFARGFALIGAVSGFVLTLSSFWILNWFRWDSREDFQMQAKHWLLSLLIMMNPMIWLMSTRYMPDLLGLTLAALVMAFTRLALNQDSQSKSFFNLVFTVGILCGILMGVRLSYAPLLIGVLVFYKNPHLYRGLTTGLLIWLVPLIIMVNPLDLLDLARQQTQGHFYQFGGSALTESHFWIRIQGFFSGFWAAGLNGAWWGRPDFLWIHSLVVILSFIYCCIYSRSRLIILPFLAYGLWILWGQNVVFKFRHQLPLVFLMILFLHPVVTGFLKSFELKKWTWIILGLLGICSYSFASLKIVQHSVSPVAMAQVHHQLQSQLVSQAQPKDSLRVKIISVQILAHFMQKQGIRADFQTLEEFLNPQYDLQQSILESLEQGQEIYLIGNALSSYIDEELLGQVKVKTVLFYHNPWVNPVWSSVHLHHLQPQPQEGLDVQ